VLVGPTPATRLGLGIATAAIALAAATGVGFARSSAGTITAPVGLVDVNTDLAYGSGSAAGTGMVLSSSGEVLTNNHVIRGAATIRTVDPTTARVFPAVVLGYSVRDDVALLQIRHPSALHPIAVGNSSRVHIGQRVTAFGNAGGVGGNPTASSGKVTLLNRSISVSDGRGLFARLTGLIQVDASLQPGDSGGPLVDATGHTIGMDTAASLGFDFRLGHVSYAIPINRALALAQQIERGHASATVHVGSTPFLGISLSPTPAPGKPGGPQVVAVAANAPADRAGIRVGDTITAIDGHAVAGYSALTAALLRHNAGAVVRVSWVDVRGTPHAARVTTIAGPPQ
jgi:S1-C subfamily serine protease